MNLFRWSAALVLATLAAVPLSAPALAQGAGDILRRHAYAGTLSAGEAELAARAAANPDDQENIAALGMARFAVAIERLGQSFYRHGLRSSDDLGMGLPVLRFPVPENPKPAELSYEELRRIYARLLADLEAARTTLAQVRSDSVRIRLDLNAVRFDLDGDGRGSDEEALGIIIAQLNQPRALRRMTRGTDISQPWTVAFDRADMIWLGGYAHLISAVTEFGLAHDWREAFLNTGHLFFPRIEGGTAVVARSQPSQEVGGETTTRIADMIAFVHLLRWQVVEPERMRAARQHLLSAIRLSRANWQAILAETDDENEWVPSPRQRSTAVPSMQVTEERVRAWHGVLDEVESVLEGRTLLAHWRLAGGIDVRRFFEEPRTFDLVMLLSGQAALPYMRDDGTAVTQTTWQDWQRAFGGNFLGFAVWFN